MRYAGQHEAIVDRAVWEEVQERLRNSATRGSAPKSNTGPSPLAGKLFDENNEPLYACRAAKNGRPTNRDLRSAVDATKFREDLF